MSPFTIDDYFLVNKVVSVLVFSVGCVAAIGNLILFISIVRSKKLRSICATFVAIQAFVEIIYPISQFSFVYFAYTEMEIPRRHCLWYQSVPLLAANISLAMMPVVAMDRYISLKAPVAYKRVNKSVFICCSLTVPLAYHAVCTYLGAIYTTDQLVFCRLPDGYTQIAVYFWVGSQCVIALIVLVLYFLVRQELKKLTIQSRDVSAAANKSLQVIFIVYVCGYAMFAFVNGASMFIEDTYLFLMLGSVSGTSAIFSFTSPVFVFYKNSKVYRQEIKATLRLLTGQRTHNVIIVKTVTSTASVR